MPLSNQSKISAKVAVAEKADKTILIRADKNRLYKNNAANTLYEVQMLKGADSTSSDSNDGNLDRRILTTLVNRYVQVNSTRLQRIISILNYHQQIFFEALPVLLHVNHPILPGFVNNFVPAGIQSYSPDKSQLSAAKTLASSFIYQPYSNDTFCPLLNITLMGSAGTIAHSYGSDMDIWVCHHPELTENALNYLQQKLTAIEKHAEKLGIELHFFMMNLESFKNGERKNLSGEDCGSTQHYLLLDEFYRTSIHLAGCHPIWWLIPPSEEKNYEVLVDKLLKKRYVNPDEFIDFGGIPEIPPGEFIGAGMWQLYKGIESPFKSVIKIMLTELYASEHPNIKPLCVNYKEAIFKGVTELDSLDPYIMMYKRLEKYLENHHPSRLDLIRKCFYLKINEPISKPASKNNLWKRDSLKQVINNWQWSSDQFKILDNRKNWKVDKVIEARVALVNELNNSYQFLSKFAREHMSSATISQDDMNILGRKLYAAFERKAGKIEFINPNIAPDISEEELTLTIDSQYEGSKITRIFSLFRGRISTEQTEYQEPLKLAESYIEIITWCFFNRIISPYSKFIRIEKDKKLDLSESESHKIISTFYQILPTGLPHAEGDNFKNKSRQEHNIFFINVGLDPFKKWNKLGVQCLSEQTNSLCYSGTRMNLVRSIDQVSINSWHEVLTSRFYSDDAVIECIVEYLRQNPRTGKWTKVPQNYFYSFSPTRAQDVANRMTQLFSEINQAFYEPKLKDDVQFIFELDTRFIIIQMLSNQIRAKEAQNFLMLTRELSQLKKQYCILKFDSYAISNHCLPFISTKLKTRTIQIFYQEKSDQKVDIYLFDEFNSLFYQSVLSQDFKNYSAHLLGFIQRIYSRYTIEFGGEHQKETKIEIARIAKSSSDQELFSLDKKKLVDFKESRNMYPVSVAIEEKLDGTKNYRFYCNNREFSELEFGDQIFDAVCNQILMLRKNQEKYPIYITDIDLSRLSERQEHQMCHYLQKKFALEFKINQLVNKGLSS